MLTDKAYFQYIHELEKASNALTAAQTVVESNSCPRGELSAAPSTLQEAEDSHQLAREPCSHNSGLY